MQTATLAVKVLKEADAGPTSGVSTANMGEACRSKHDRPTLRQPSFYWKASDKYVELLHFKMEVMNTLQTRTYKLNYEERVTIIKTG